MTKTTLTEAAPSYFRLNSVGTKKKLIEVALPLEAINRESAREKSIRHGHPSTLHLWWSRKPLATCRAVLFASLVDDPSSRPEEFPTEEARERERQRLFGIIEELVKWENSNNEQVLTAAREEILKSTDGNPPPVLDPFCGGGSIPLEAQRLGLQAIASDLNPVAVLITKALIEIPPKFAGQPPVNPEVRRTLLGTSTLGAPASSPAPRSTTQATRDRRRDAGNDAGETPALPATPSPPASLSHKGWYSRNYLPHFDHPGLIQCLTFRLADSLPQSVLDDWSRELESLPAEARQTERERRIAAFLDAGYGACWLQDARVAELVENALFHFDGERYRLLAWCVMPNHVHAIVEMKEGAPLSEVVHSWKSFSAHGANRLLGRTGEFWMREYHDRFIRDEAHLASAIRYVEENPVKAGLAATPEEWRFSSAWWRHHARVKPEEEPGAPTLGAPASSPASRSTKLEPGTSTLGAPASSPAPRSTTQATRDRRRDAGNDADAPSMWRGAAGLAEDVRHYGQWMRDEAEKRIGHLYPKVKLPAEHGGGEATVIAWLWARTVTCPNPACGAQMPLVNSFWLSTKKGKEAWVEPIVDHAAKSVRFEVRTGAGTPPESPKTGRGAKFRCLVCGQSADAQHIKSEGAAKRMQAQLLATVAEGRNGRLYLPATEEQETCAHTAQPNWQPEQPLADDPRSLWCLPYGLTTFADLFTPRQLVALTTFSGLVGEARERVRRDAVAAGLPDDGVALGDGGRGATAYADAVATYLAFAVDRCADYWSGICSWHTSRENMRNTFARQAIPMTWDFAEANPFSASTGNFSGAVDWVEKVIAAHPGGPVGFACQMDATRGLPGGPDARGLVVSTDPPYYDNIGYADLSDFFYVWLRRSLNTLYPDLFSTLLTPKAGELVATPYRFGGDRERARRFFEEGLGKAFGHMRERALPDYPLTIFYAFKQSESEGTEVSGSETTAVASTGWETMLEGLIDAGFAVTGTWPMRTELANRSVGHGTNALASSIAMICRPRPADAPDATRREFLSALKAELPEALRAMQQGNIAPVDLAQAAIGPGMAVFSRYSRVLEADGTPMRVRTALALINQTLDEVLSEQEGEFDADTRWALAWYEQWGTKEAPFGVAETLSKAKNTSIPGLEEAGIVTARGGKVRLRSREELPPDWNPATHKRCTIWETMQHLIRRLEGEGEESAARLLQELGPMGESARDLAYRLYHVCDRKGWSQEAQAFNSLVVHWPGIKALGSSAGAQKRLELS